MALNYLGACRALVAQRTELSQQELCELAGSRHGPDACLSAACCAGACQSLCASFRGVMCCWQRAQAVTIPGACLFG